MNFWLWFIILLFVLVVNFLVIDRFVLSKKENRQELNNRLINYHLIAGIVLLLVLMIIFIPTRIFLSGILEQINNISVLVLATTGIVLIFKTSTTTNFAQGTLGSFGAFVAARFISNNFYNLGPSAILFAGLIAGALVAFILGLLIDVVIIRNAKQVTPVGKQMITMGLVFVISSIIPLIFGVIPLTVPRFSYDIVSFTFLGYALTVPKHSLYTLVITVSVLIVLFSALRLTKWGLGVRATASNEVVAKMMGVNTRVITAMSWAIAGALGGIAGVLMAPYFQLSPALMLPVQVNGFLASILGGFSTFAGPIIGAILIPLLNSLFAYFNSSWPNVIVYCLILLIVLIKPYGLLGKKVPKKV